MSERVGEAGDNERHGAAARRAGSPEGAGGCVAMAAEVTASPGPSLLSLSLPVAMGYVPLGAVFGFLLVQAGAPWWVPALASVLVFAGAAQFMAVPLLAAGASPGTIAAATAIINLRHIFYGLSLLDRLPRGRLARGYLIWTLTDENYAVLTALPQQAGGVVMLRVAALNHLWWVLGSLAGSVLATQVAPELTGLDFALAALFAVLTVEQWRASATSAPIVVALCSYGLALAVWPSQALTLAIALCVIAALALPERRRDGARGDD